MLSCFSSHTSLHLFLSMPSLRSPIRTAPCTCSVHAASACLTGSTVHIAPSWLRTLSFLPVLCCHQHFWGGHPHTSSSCTCEIISLDCTPSGGSVGLCTLRTIHSFTTYSQFFQTDAPMEVSPYTHFSNNVLYYSTFYFCQNYGYKGPCHSYLSLNFSEGQELT